MSREYSVHNGFIYTILEYDLVQTFNALKSVDAPESPGKLEDAPIGVPALVTGIQTPLRETPPSPIKGRFTHLRVVLSSLCLLA